MPCTFNIIVQTYGKKNYIWHLLMYINKFSNNLVWKTNKENESLKCYNKKPFLLFTFTIHYSFIESYYLQPK